MQTELKFYISDVANVLIPQDYLVKLQISVTIRGMIGELDVMGRVRQQMAKEVSLLEKLEQDPEAALVQMAQLARQMPVGKFAPRIVDSIHSGKRVTLVSSRGTPAEAEVGLGNARMALRHLNTAHLLFRSSQGAIDGFDVAKCLEPTLSEGLADLLILEMRLEGWPKKPIVQAKIIQKTLKAGDGPKREWEKRELRDLPGLDTLFSKVARPAVFAHLFCQLELEEREDRPRKDGYGYGGSYGGNGYGRYSRYPRW